MAVEIKVPALGESVSEATIAKWHKSEGEAIGVDELLVELETDKVTLEVNAPSAGVLAKIDAKEGDTVEVGALLGSIDENAKAAAVSAAPPPQSQVAPPSLPAPAAGTVSGEGTAITTSGEQILSPSAAKLATERGIDVSSIRGTGKDGRVTKEDVAGARTLVAPTGGAAPSALSNELREERVKMSRLRQTIAKRLKESQNTAAILSTFNEVDMSEIFRIRKSYQDQFVETHGCKLGFMSFFTKAVVNALKEIPAVNAEINGDEIIYKNYYDIGVAVGTPAGLVVPIIRDTDRMSFADIEKEIVSLAKKARDGKLSMAEMTGGTFSITNGGTYGSLLSTPIINPPQSGILGMHNIVQRPMVVNGEIKIRPMMYIALSYDHRIIDGKDAVTFLVRIKQMIENPEKLLFDI